ncbi:MAG TPA: carbon starvation protein A [Tepidisphaeraceae bacterium]|nr:carbon starvation protein A [Tepidisphaeraceae bacterium]
MSAMPVMLAILCAMMVAYRYYSAFLATKVAVLDADRPTPAVRHHDGQNYHPTSKWVLFGHHFAAISGAGPLIGPVLAAQFGYLPGLLWIVIGVCLAGAVQDFLVLSASIRRDGKSLAQIAFTDIGPVAGTASMAAILFIIIIALAGLGKVVVKALGGESVKSPPGSELVFQNNLPTVDHGLYHIPAGTVLRWDEGKSSMAFSEKFDMRIPSQPKAVLIATRKATTMTLPADAVRVVPGSSWGTFTIACTIPIALFVGLYMYKLRKGRVVEASIIGGILTLAATVAGGWVAQNAIGKYFALTDTQVIIAMAIYGFVAAVLPVWILLAPRDYLSSFLKVGTIGILVIGVVIANPKLHAPAINHVFLHGGPAVAGNIFPFLFITIMCGAISGFHALVASGTTPKMIQNERDARAVGYGAMLMEGLVACVAMIAAATLPVQNYYAMNTDLAKMPQYANQILQVGGGIEHLNPANTMTVEDYERLTHESLRGRTGGAVTLAVGMADIFDHAAAKFSAGAEETLQTLWKYWYHFAIMFEALFILTTIDAGTRIGRFLLQEVFGKFHPALGRPNWWPGVIVSTALIVLAWAYFINANSMAVIWPMFGIANQMLAVIALAIVSAYLANEGRAKYLWLTVLPMLFVFSTTSTAAVEMFNGQMSQVTNQIQNSPDVRNWPLLINSAIEAALILAMLLCAMIVMLAGAMRVWQASTRQTSDAPAEAPIA